MEEDRNMIKIGPVGSSNGKIWDEKGRNKIVQIFISHDIRIKSIQFQYSENRNRNFVLSDRHGASTGRNFESVKLDHTSEYITWISGHTSKSGDYLTSMTFGTNTGTYGPIGKPGSGDEKFNFRLDNQQFGGFHGTADEDGVNSIGVYLKPWKTISLEDWVSSLLEDEEDEIFGYSY